MAVDTDALGVALYEARVPAGQSGDPETLRKAKAEAEAIGGVVDDQIAGANTRRLALSAAAEAADAIVVTVQLEDGAEDSVSEALICRAQLLDENAELGAVADWTIAETGAGTEISTTARPALLFQLSAGGAAALTVTDVNGASDTTVYLLVEVFAGAGDVGQASYLALTFDGA